MKNAKAIRDYIFKNYRSRNLPNLTKIIKQIKEKRPDFPDNILDQLVEAGLIRRMSGNLSQVHYETI